MIKKGQNILERDAIGKCMEGECRNRDLEARRERQSEIKSEAFSTGDGTVSPPDAMKRNAPPGFLGGHV